MSDSRYAYQRWVCSACDSEPIEERTGDYDLRCENCGNTYRTNGAGYAEFVPDPDDAPPTTSEGETANGN